MSNKDFKEKAIALYGDKYIYDKVEYKNNHTKVVIVCKKHGEFLTRPSSHINGKGGCPICKKENTGNRCRKTKEVFIEEAKAVHGNKYDYSLVEYKNTDTKIVIICSKHGEFKQTPYCHVGQKCGCPKCSIENKTNRIISLNKKRKTEKEYFVTNSIKVHGDKYNYNLITNYSSKSKVNIICPIHGVFSQYPMNHLKSLGCPKCVNEDKKISKEDIVERVKDIYGDSITCVEYDSITTPATLNCKIHGYFVVRKLSDFIYKGYNCPHCSSQGISKTEKDVMSFINENHSGTILNNARDIIDYELDIYLPNEKIAFEFNGLYWHSEKYKDSNYHLLKTQQCEERGIHLIHIFEDQWLYKQDIVKSRILNILGCSQKIYAKSTEIREVSYNDSVEFLNNNHIQGSSVSKYRYGLYLGEELVSIMTFGAMRKNVGSSDVPNHYELLRFCNKMNTTVVGGASKLFKHFIKEMSPEVVISYADRSWTMNNDNTLYHQLGFEFKGETRPNYYYIIDSKRENRFKHRKSELVAQGFDENKSEKEIMLERNIFRIYDSGQLKFSYKK